MELILKHLKKKPGRKAKNITCTLCGKRSISVFSLKDLLSSNFNDWQVLKFDSKWVCEDCASGFRRNSFEGKSIRSFNILATEDYIKKIEKKEIIDVIKNHPQKKFEIQVTFTHKKHAFFYCKINNPKSPFLYIGTDWGLFILDKNYFVQCYDVAKKLYEGGFNKKEIEVGKSLKFNKIEKYGLGEYQNDMDFLEFIRKTLTLKFLLHILVKGDNND